MGNELVIQNANNIKLLAESFVKSGYWKDITEVSKGIAKIARGAELGIGPASSLSNIYIVEGQMELKATLIGALIKQSKKYDYIPREHTAIYAKIEWFQNGESIGFSEFSKEEADKAKISGHWIHKTYPEAIMFNRALTKGARMYCPDVFMGSVYSEGEIEPQEPQSESIQANENIVDIPKSKQSENGIPDWLKAKVLDTKQLATELDIEVSKEMPELSDEFKSLLEAKDYENADQVNCTIFQKLREIKDEREKNLSLEGNDEGTANDDNE